MFLARLDTDGSVDDSFDTGTGPSNSVQRIIPYGIDKYLLVGGFTVYNEEGRNKIMVLNSNGSLNPSFSNVVSLSVPSTLNAVAVQDDGKIILGGEVNQTFHPNGIVRLNPDGTADNEFNPGTGIGFNNNPVISNIHIQPDGRIIATGSFSEFDGNPVGNIVRLMDDGSFDPSFNAGTGTDGIILSITPTESGAMVLTERFTSCGGITSTGLVVIDVDGSFSSPRVQGTGFQAGGIVHNCLYQEDGKLIVVDDFTTYDIQSANRIIRLNSDLTVDPTFVTGTGAMSTFVQAIVQQWDGRPLIGGLFTRYNNNQSNRLARISSDACVYRLLGTVTLAGSPVSAGKVYVYTEQLQRIGYAMADSADIIEGQYVFDSLVEFPVSYILKAVPDAVLYPSDVAIPTFFSPEGPSHKWNNPDNTYSLNSNCGNIDTVNISVLQPEAGTVPPGTTTISGQITWADGKVEADPIPLIDIVVERVPPGNSAFAHTQTDEQGNFLFTNLPLTAGESYVYGIHVSFPGIPMGNTYLINVTEEGQNFSGLDFLVDTMFNIIHPVVNIWFSAQEKEYQTLSIRPNPMTEVIEVLLSDHVTLPKSYKVRDIMGRELAGGPVEGHRFRFFRENWPAGLYMVEVNGQDGSILVEPFLVKENRKR